MGILPLKKRVNRDKCSFATKQRMFGVFAIDEILRYRGSRIPGSPTLCHPATNIIGSEEEFMNVSSLVNRASIPVAASIILPPKNNDHGSLSLQVLSPADPGSRVGLVVIKPKPPVPLPTGPENILMKSVSK